MTQAVAWGTNREADFISWIDYELLQAQQARIGLDRQHRDWLSQYRTSAKQAAKSFPYEGAFNYELPLTAIDVDILYARFMQTIHAPENLWSVTPMNERWVAAAKPLQDFLTILDQRVLHMYDVNTRVFLECVKLGTGIYKTQWKHESRKVWGYDANGKRVQTQRVTSVPVVDHVKLADFLFPAYSYAIQPDAQGGAPWVAERLRPSLSQLYAMTQASGPFLPTVDRATVDFIAKFVEPEVPPMDAKIQELDFARRANPGSATKLDGDDFDKDRERGPAQGASLQRPREVELWEIHARFDTTGDRSDDDIVVWYHQPTRRIVRAVYAAQDWRPYDKITYFPGDGFWGIGVCEQKEMFQKLGSDLANFTLDNVVLANSRAVVAKSSANIAPGEPIYPWKVFVTDGNVRDEFGVFPMADIYPSLPMMQNFIGGIGEKRTGIGDIQAGNIDSLPGRTPATTMLSLLQEGNRRPDLTIKNMRNQGLGIVGLRVLQLCQQYMASPRTGDNGEQWMQIITDILGQPEGAHVAEKLVLPMEPVEFGVGVNLTATSGSANKEVERQGALALLQLAGQVSPQIIQLVQLAEQTQGTATSEVALKAARGLDTLYQRTLEQYDVRNSEDVALLVDVTSSQNVPPQGMPQGVPIGSQGPAIDPQLAAILSGVQQ